MFDVVNAVVNAILWYFPDFVPVP